MKAKNHIIAQAGGSVDHFYFIAIEQSQAAVRSEIKIMILCFQNGPDGVMGQSAIAVDGLKQSRTIDVNTTAVSPDIKDTVTVTVNKPHKTVGQSVFFIKNQLQAIIFQNSQSVIGSHKNLICFSPGDLVDRRTG